MRHIPLITRLATTMLSADMQSVNLKMNETIIS